MHQAHVHVNISRIRPEWLTNERRRANIVSAAIRENYYCGAVMKR
jgi:hypothetical protein